MPRRSPAHSRPHLALALMLASCASDAPGRADATTRFADATAGPTDATTSPTDAASASDASTTRADASTADAGPLPSVTGHAYYAFGDDTFRIEARAGATPESVSAALDRLGPGTRDRFAAPSPNGAWIALAADRGGCGGECLIRVNRALTELEAVLPDGQEAYPEGTAAITDDGALVVYAAKGGPHEIDLFATRRSGAGWGAPVLLTAASSYTYNNSPALSFDGSKVVFDCGAMPYPEDGGNDACEVGVDGSGFRRLIGPDALAGSRNAFVQFPHLSPDGLLVQGSWPIAGSTPETIWLLPSGGGAPTPIGRAFDNAVSPCGLRDGRFFLLWLSRPGNREGKHELTLVGRDGALISVLTPDVDVNDIGIGCGD